MANEVDIKENKLLAAHENVFKQLLYDHNTRKNIFWATDSYAGLGKGYEPHDEITIEKITGSNGNVIRPRAVKSRGEQSRRVKDMAEVFTPSSICKAMNDEVFPLSNAGLQWQQPALATYLEITCGEAPFLVSRYDTVSGEPIPINKRIGILDRKLRIVNNSATDEEYARWALLVLGSVYGYEWQGDNLFLAREAVLTTFAEYYRLRFGSEPDEPLLLKAAEIVSWNLWQMDGLKAVVPDTCHETTSSSFDLFGEEQSFSTPCPGCAKDNILLHNGIRCRLRRWLPEAIQNSALPRAIDFFEFSFLDIINKKTKIHNKTKYAMKFDYIIGNPPYNEETKDTSDQPVYYKIMDEAYKLARKVELITPARFLFNAGKTPKNWNKKMLQDKHLKVLDFQQDSSLVFSDTNIKGGIAITYHDITQNFGAIETFTLYPKLNSILNKVNAISKGNSLENIIYTQNKFKLDDLYKDHPECEKIIGSNGKERRLTASILYQLDIFKEQKTRDDIAILGLINSKRVTRYIPIKYIDQKETNLQKWKVLVPKSNGSGVLGEVLSSPLIVKPLIGYTQTFLGIGSFNSEAEAQAAYKYICGKFSRTMLGVLKITQDNPPKKWKYVPLQDFTSSSDIDWSKSIHEIDLQLYAKYDLDATETAFIERMVKPMD